MKSVNRKILVMYTPAFPDKAAMLAGLQREQQVAVTSTAYAGDQSEDSSASNANGLAFCTAPWGHRGLPTGRHIGALDRNGIAWSSSL